MSVGGKMEVGVRIGHDMSGVGGTRRQLVHEISDITVYQGNGVWERETNED